MSLWHGIAWTHKTFDLRWSKNVKERIETWGSALCPVQRRPLVYRCAFALIRICANTFYRAMLRIRSTSHGPLSVCLSSRCSIETDERIELVFGMWTSFHPSYTVLKGNSVISKNKGTSLWNFVLKSGLRKFCHGISIVETCYQLSLRKVDAQSVINWTVVGQLSR